MNTTVSIDKAICNRAAKRAKMEKVSVSAVVRILLSNYAEGKLHIHTVVSEEPVIEKVEEIEVDEKTQKLMDKVIKAWNKSIQ